MKAKIEITMNNAAFEDQPATELARILRECAVYSEEGATEMTLRDINGNKVGKFEVIE